MKHSLRDDHRTADEIEARIVDLQASADALPDGVARRALLDDIAQLRGGSEANSRIGSELQHA